MMTVDELTALSDEEIVRTVAKEVMHWVPNSPNCWSPGGEGTTTCDVICADIDKWNPLMNQRDAVEVARALGLPGGPHDNTESRRMFCLGVVLIAMS
jgi:hypothetical protein